MGSLAAVGCGAVVRSGLRPALRALLWAACVPAGITAFGLLMDVITLMFGQGVDSGVAAANHALAAAGVVLLAATARPVRPPSSRTVAAVPSAASGPVQLAACAGTVAFLPYAAMKLVWASGGTFAGVSGAEMALGVFLLWGLVRPWGQAFPRWTPWLRGRRVPRRLPLAPALIGAATLAPYGVFGVGYAALTTAGVVTMRRGDFPSSSDALLVGWIGMAAFAVPGSR
ncbi:hypothetical protein [Streptomyces mutabilis]|uniref:hypothetical protein n=1 Tax=Streptomyces mutabilis TaxID=67332 RepID=UPI0034DEAE18